MTVKTKAVKHYERTGTILPGHQAEIARYRGGDE